MVLSGTINKQLVRAFLAEDVPAVGVSGEDGALLMCRLFAEGSLGAVGEPAHVDPRLLNVLMSEHFVPVVSPLGRLQSTGEGCNVNGDDAAAAIAVALSAEELLLIADVAGVRGADGEILPVLDEEGARDLIASGAATGGMIAKLEAALRALQAGVPRVRIGNVQAIASPTDGTTIAASKLHASAR
jgi:acetylglutamate kinase